MSHAVTLVTEDRATGSGRHAGVRGDRLDHPIRIPALDQEFPRPRRSLPSWSLPSICTNHRQQRRLRCSEGCLSGSRR